jgi:hypothetical protein
MVGRAYPRAVSSFPILHSSSLKIGVVTNYVFADTSAKIRKSKSGKRKRMRKEKNREARMAGKEYIGLCQGFGPTGACAHRRYSLFVPSVCSCSKICRLHPILRLFTSIIAYYRLMAPICTFFPGKKDCLSFWKGRRESTQIKGRIPRAGRKANKSRPKTRPFQAYAR